MKKVMKSSTRMIYIVFTLLIVTCCHSFRWPSYKISRNRLLSKESDDLSDFKAILFDDSIPEGFRKKYMLLHTKLWKTETAVEHQKHETNVVLTAIANQTYAMRRMMTRNMAMNPRAIIDYAERCVMPSSYAGMSQKSKWEKFFREVDVGKGLASALVLNTSLFGGSSAHWSDDPASLADRIERMHNFVVYPIYEGSWKRKTCEEELEESRVLCETMIAVACIAEHCGVMIQPPE
jgi:hypothetical protein